MGIGCGSQITLCEYPIHLDTYKGCTHDCKYCFARNKSRLENVSPMNCVKAAENFIRGKRTSVTNWCDWAIPLHWGGLSDPFQPAERKYGVSLEMLKLFARTGYPVIISTKGSIIAEDEYLSVLKRCNAVVQFSIVCKSYDVLEQGAGPFEDRLKALEKVSQAARRTVVRVQPYMPQVRDEVLENVPRFRDAGAHGITIEGMKFKRKKPGLVKVEGDWCFSDVVLKSHYELIREAAHANGLAFYCAENRLRRMGDSYACCGCGDIDGFRGNTFNLVSLADGLDVRPTEAMRMIGTGSVFHSTNQSPGSSKADKEKPFAEHMMEHYRSKNARKVRA